MNSIEIGTDEAGYGPILGPMIISTVGFKIPESAKNKSLYTLTGLSNDSKSEFPVCDSKLLFGQSKKKYQKGERVVLAFLNLVTPKIDLPFSSGKFFKEIVVSFHQDNFSFPCGHNHCFTANFPIIHSQEEYKEIETLTEEIRFQLKKHKVEFLKPIISAICVKEFNQLCSKYKKSDVIIEEGLLNIKQLARMEHFNAKVGMISSSKTCEKYVKMFFECKDFRKTNKKDFTFTMDGNSIQYLIDAEDKSFCVALASMFGKYTRELLWKSLIRTKLNEIPMERYISGYRDNLSMDFIKKLKDNNFNKLPTECLLRIK